MITTFLWSELADLFFWKCSRLLAKLSSSLSGSNDTCELLSDDFDCFTNSVPLFLLSCGLVIKGFVSSFSNMGLYERGFNWCGCLRGKLDICSVLVSNTIVSRLVAVDEFDKVPSAVLTRWYPCCSGSLVSSWQDEVNVSIFFKSNIYVKMVWFCTMTVQLFENKVFYQYHTYWENKQ